MDQKLVLMTFMSDLTRSLLYLKNELGPTYNVLRRQSGAILDCNFLTCGFGALCEGRGGSTLSGGNSPKINRRL